MDTDKIARTLDALAEGIGEAVKVARTPSVDAASPAAGDAPGSQDSPATSTDPGAGSRASSSGGPLGLLSALLASPLALLALVGLGLHLLTRR